MRTSKLGWKSGLIKTTRLVDGWFAEFGYADPHIAYDMYGYGCAPTSDGSLFVAAAIDSPAATFQGASLHRVSRDGALMWSRGLTSGTYGTTWNVATDANDYAYVTAGAGYDLFTAKFAPNGTPMWTKYNSGGGTQYAIATDGTHVWTCDSSGFVHRRSATTGVLSLKVDISILGYALLATSISCDGSGNAYIAGNMYNYGPPLLVKIDSSGTVQWIVGKAGSGRHGSVATVCPDGNIAFAFYNVATGGNVVSKIDAATGSLLWAVENNVYGTVALGLSVDAAGNIYLVDFDYFFNWTKFASNGTQLLCRAGAGNDTWYLPQALAGKYLYIAGVTTYATDYGTQERVMLDKLPTDGGGASGLYYWPSGNYVGNYIPGTAVFTPSSVSFASYSATVTTHSVSESTYSITNLDGIPFDSSKVNLR